MKISLEYFKVSMLPSFNSVQYSLSWRGPNHHYRNHTGDAMKRSMMFLLILIPMLVSAQDTIQPSPTHKPSPVYPENAKKLRVEAQIFLTVLITDRGIVQETDLFQASIRYPGGSAVLESRNDLVKVPSSHRNSAAKLIEISQQTAKQWRFTPARINGKPQESMIIIPFTFRLNTSANPPPDPRFRLKK